MTAGRIRQLTFFWAAFTAALLLMPSRTFHQVPVAGAFEIVLDVGAHFFLFGVLALLAVRGFGDAPFAIGRRSRVFGAVAGYCVLLEILQMPVPGRGFELLDIAVGWLAIVIGFAWRRRLRAERGNSLPYTPRPSDESNRAPGPRH